MDDLAPRRQRDARDARQVAGDWRYPSALVTASTNPRVQRLRRDMRLLQADGAAAALTMGLAEAYFVAFALAAGLSQVEAGLIATVPVLVGAMIHSITPWGVRCVRSLRLWVSCFAALQALALLALSICALLGSASAPMVYLLVSLYWAAGFCTAPPWQTWVPTLIPRLISTHFWTSRSRTVQALLGLGLLGGLILEWGRQTDHVLVAFSITFFLAFLTRAASAVFLARHSEPKPELAAATEPPSLSVLRRDLWADRSVRTLLVYMLAVVLATNVSAAFITPYMLNELKFTYTQLMCAFAVTFSAKVLALPGVGRLAKRYGPGVPLWLGAIGIIPTATLYLVSDSFWWILFLQFSVGMAWACWETATFLLVFDVIPSERRTSVMTVYNIVQSTAVVSGSLIGATILGSMEVGRQGYAMVFVATGVMRLMTLFLLAGIEPRRFKLRQTFDLYLQTLGIGFGDGAIDIPQITESSKPAAPHRTPDEPH